MTSDLTYIAALRETLRPENALEIGKAAEHLVCADLLLRGYRCYLSDQGLPYDIVVDTGDRLVVDKFTAAA